MISLLVSACFCSTLSPAAERPTVVLVVGAPGAPEYEGMFRQWAGRWQEAARKASAELVTIGLGASDNKTNDKDRLRSVLAERAASGSEPLWLVLIGHGTYDGREARYNLRGPDVSDRELADWLAPAKRPLVLLDCTSASSPFLTKLSGENRVVVTATRSGHEQNLARFGQYLAEAVTDPAADLDKDGQVSLLEAYLTAAHRVADYYRTRSQLATEHPLLDDNGDRLGTPPDWFRGVRATRRAKDGAALDGLRAHQIHLVPSDRERTMPLETRRRRDQLEREVATLRDRKAKLSEDEYFGLLEPLMLELGRLYRAAPGATPTRSSHEH